MQNFFQPNQQPTNIDIESQDRTANNQLENNEPKNEPKAKNITAPQAKKKKTNK